MQLKFEQIMPMKMRSGHLISMQQLFSLNLRELQLVRERFDAMSDHELSQFGTPPSDNGSGRKAFYDRPLEELAETVVAGHDREPDVTLHLGETGLTWDYNTIVTEERTPPSDPEKERTLIRGSRQTPNSLVWTMEAVRKMYDQVLTKQRNYLISGRTEDLKPITYDELGEEIGCHPSTVWRLAKGKEIKALDGTVMPLNSLIVREEQVSRLQAIEVIAPMIRDGTYTTAQKAADAVYEATGIEISRRTAQKYKEQIKDYLAQREGDQ